LTQEVNQAELKRHRDIILATINYSSEKAGRRMKIDGRNPWESRYQKLMQQTEKYFQSNKLEKLKQTLAKVLEEPRNMVDLYFDNYIKEKTGYEIKIFQNIRESADKIFEQKRIKNWKELRDASCMIHLLRQESPDENKMAVLNNLCFDFVKRSSRKQQVEDNYIPKELSHIHSPNKKFRLIVSEDNGEYGTTTVSVNSKYGGASVYDAEGVNLNIKAYWKNDSTIIIESKRRYKFFLKRNQIQFYDDVIEIELIEK
jgi:hypothetical protein